MFVGASLSLLIRLPRKVHFYVFLMVIGRSYAVLIDINFLGLVFTRKTIILQKIVFEIETSVIPLQLPKLLRSPFFGGLHISPLLHLWYGIRLPDVG